MLFVHGKSRFSHLLSLDSKFPDHPTNEWNTEELGETILNVVNRIKPHSVSNRLKNREETHPQRFFHFRRMVLARQTFCKEFREN